MIGTFDNKIIIAAMERKRTPIFEFKLSVKTPRNWYQKLILFCAKKAKVVGLEEFEKSATIEKHQIDLHDITKAICEQRDNLRQIESKQARYVLIGADLLPKLNETMSLGLHQMPFYYNSRPMPYGLELIFVPYMSGVLVLPDIEALKR